MHILLKSIVWSTTLLSTCHQPVTKEYYQITDNQSIRQICLLGAASMYMYLPGLCSKHSIVLFLRGNILSSNASFFRILSNIAVSWNISRAWGAPIVWQTQDVIFSLQKDSARSSLQVKVIIAYDPQRPCQRNGRSFHKEWTKAEVSSKLRNLFPFVITHSCRASFWT